MGGTEQGGDNENGGDSEEVKEATEMDEVERAKPMKDVVNSIKIWIEEGCLELAMHLDTQKTDDDECENEFQINEIAAAIPGSK
eukprot:8948997-Ditylum_brightwellii.AAC.1